MVKDDILNNTIRLCCPCHFGLESVLKYEITRIGGTELKISDGKISFTGDENILARANLSLSTAERVLIELAEFPARTYEELFQGVKAIELERYITAKNAFPVKGYSLNSTLHSVPDCQSIVKKAIVERLKAKYGIAWFEETAATVQVQFTILKDEVSLLIDTSGAGLHKRGYRQNAGGAPIKETLAAAIVDVTRARLADRVIDPCCGSGTLLIEAALAARRIAPGIRRRFAFMDWDWVPDEVWRAERQRAMEQVLSDRAFTAIGGDIDPEAVRLVTENAAKAGVASEVRASVRDLRQFVPEGDSGVVLCNPPYGERLLDIQTAQELYRVMGQVFVPKAGWSYAIISPDETFEEQFGRKADKRRKLYNGMLKCQLYCYYR